MPRATPIELAESDEHLMALAPTADAILTCFRRVPAGVLDAATRCITVARYGVGVDNIDVAHATQLGVVVSNVPEFCTEEVADHTLLLALASLRNLRAATDTVRGGGWQTDAGTRAQRVRGQVFGIIGYGAIGKAVADRAAAFGFEVIVTSRALASDPASVPSHVSRVVDRDSLLAEADIVSLHVPLTPQTHGAVAARELAMMKDGALLINVSRGGLVDTEALRPELESGRLQAALDVTDPEPLPADHWLRSNGNADRHSPRGVRLGWVACRTGHEGDRERLAVLAAEAPAIGREPRRVRHVRAPGAPPGGDVTNGIYCSMAQRHSMCRAQNSSSAHVAGMPIPARFIGGRVLSSPCSRSAHVLRGDTTLSTDWSDTNTG